MTYRKIGGIHWFRIGRWRISVCRVRSDAEVIKTKVARAVRGRGPMPTLL